MPNLPGFHPFDKAAPQARQNAAQQALDRRTSTNERVRMATERLEDLAVTTAKIADGAVATAKIADGAVNSAKLGLTYNRVAGVTSTVNGTFDGTWRQVADLSMSLTTAGGPVLIGYSVNWSFDITTGGWIDTAIYINGSRGQYLLGNAIRTVVYDAGSPPAQSRTNSHVALAIPPAGTHTIAVFYAGSATTGSMHETRRDLWAIEF